MPTTLAIEAKLLRFEDIGSGFYHLYLVKTVTDDNGKVTSEKVIRGSLGSDFSLQTLANVNLSASPDRRGSDTLQERHRTELDLGGRDPNDVWNIMTQHARNIDRANLDYSFDIARKFPGGDVNSNSVVASVLYSVGINWSNTYPTGITQSKVPLYGQLTYMRVNDVITGTDSDDRIRGGQGNDNLGGGLGDDRLFGDNGNDRVSGGIGNDSVSGGAGDDRLYGRSGQDDLIGGTGRDAFVFTSALTPENVDRITDFSVVNDTVWLDNRIFIALTREGTLRSSAFWTGTEAHDTSDRVIYDRADGVLYYDPDGTGAAEQVAFATLSEGLRMTSADFRVI